MTAADGKPNSRRASASGKSADVHTARRKRLGAAIAELGLDGLIISSARDIRYLTPFIGDDSTGIVRPNGSMTVVCDFRYEEDLAVLPPNKVDVVLRKGEMGDAVIGVVRDMKLAIIGIQAEHTTVATRAALAKGIGAKKLKDTRGVLYGLRIVKDAVEVKAIRRAASIQQAAMEALLATVKPGQTELAVAAQLEWEMKVRGSEGPAFGVIVAAGANGSKPHSTPGKAKVAAGKPLLIDWGATVDGYRSDMTRTFAIGRWNRKIREIYGIVLEAKNAATAAIRPGVRCIDVDAVARGIIERAGYGDRFGHGLGHGIGLDIHEGPRLSKTSRETLREGMIVTVEPGIYLPGVGGVRIEDDVLVTSRGRENLCSLPTDIDWATR